MKINYLFFSILINEEFGNATSFVILLILNISFK